MLYERWRQIARNHSSEVALHDVGLGEQMTFSQLAKLGESASSNGPIAFPQGPDLIVTLLRAWRAGQAVCPLEQNQAAPQFASLPPGCVHLKTTSATGGTARVVAFTAEQLAADADNIVATMGLRPDWPNLGVISLAHSYGFSNLVLPLLLHGIPLILAEMPLPEMVRQAADCAPDITLAAVPALWSVWHEAGAIPANVRLAISAGAPLSLALEQSVFETRGLKIHNFYGSSECGGIAYDGSTTPRMDAACVGSPMKNVDLSVGEDGCMQVRGKAVGQTYWPRPASNLADGCFRTSDLVEIKSGLIYIRGRADDQINLSGRKLSPEEIEKALRGHPGVTECVVFGVPSEDEERTDTIVACVAGRSKLHGEALKQFLLDKIPAWQVPREWIFVEAIEVNARGKVSRVEWKRRFLAGELVKFAEKK